MSSRCYNVFTVAASSFKTDGQWLQDHITKFARWQHPAVRHVARFAVHGITYYSSVSCGFVSTRPMICSSLVIKKRLSSIQLSHMPIDKK